MRSATIVGCLGLGLLAACASVANAAMRKQRLEQLDEETTSLALSSAPRASGAGSASPSSSRAEPSRPAVFGHSHNDYEQPRPLRDALDLGYRSVEADVWWSGGEVKVSHRGWFYVGTLRELYLDPLQARVARLGSVYGDGAPFLLWLDLKQADPALLVELHRLLAAYPMIASADHGDGAGQVNAILTGDAKSKEAYTRRPGAHYACRDSNQLQPPGPADPLHLWYALDWNDWFTWDGRGEIPLVERTRLHALVARAHGFGRKLRLYGLPESEALWGELLLAGVDLIGTDELPRLQRFLQARLQNPLGARTGLANSAPRP